MKIAVVAIHGIGNNQANFADDLAKLIKKQLNSKEEIEVKIFACYWKNLLSPTEGMLFHNTEHMGWKTLRMLMIEFVGDATAYQLSSDFRDFYGAVHQRVDDILSEVDDWLADDGKMIFVAHSLGTIISNNFIWDAQNPDSAGNKYHQASDKAQAALKHLDTFYTAGSPILVWSLQSKDGGMPIDVQCWKNVYSNWDIIGYPLKDINDKYAKNTKIQDIRCDVGSLLYKFTPMAHVCYFTDKKFVNMIVKDIQRITT